MRSIAVRLDGSQVKTFLWGCRMGIAPLRPNALDRSPSRIITGPDRLIRHNLQQPHKQHPQQGIGQHRHDRIQIQRIELAKPKHRE